MKLTAEPEPGVESRILRPVHYDHDLPLELMQRQEAFRSCDRYINSSGFSDELLDAWAAIKGQEEMNQKQFQELVGEPTAGLPMGLHDLAFPDQPPSPWKTKS